MSAPVSFIEWRWSKGCRLKSIAYARSVYDIVLCVFVCLDGWKRYVNDDRLRVDGDKNMRLPAFAFTIVFLWMGPKNYCDKSICRKLIVNSQVTINKKNDENRVWNNSFLQKQLLSAQKYWNREQQERSSSKRLESHLRYYENLLQAILLRNEEFISIGMQSSSRAEIDRWNGLLMARLTTPNLAFIASCSLYETSIQITMIRSTLLHNVYHRLVFFLLH